MSYFYRSLIYSVLLHILCVGAYIAFSNYEPALKRKPPSIQVSIAQLGQTRDPKLLPRLDVSEAPKSLEIASHKKTAPKKIPPKKQNNPLDLLKKRFGKPTHEGQKQGTVLGNSLRNELADSYELQVAQLLKNHYEIPRIISEQEAKHLRVSVRLWIDFRGQLIKIKIEQASTNQNFDQAVILSSQRIASFGAPPLLLARKYKTEGLLVQFCPLECL